MEDEYEEEQPWNDDQELEECPEDQIVEDSGQVQSECVEKFASTDYIMEPGIFNTLKRYFQFGGNPETVIDLLSDNYKGVAQSANLVAEWMVIAGVNQAEVQTLIESHLKSMIVKHFDPKKADTIFTEEGETPSWLTDMIHHQPWRSLIYKLAEDYPECLMLNFTIKLISDAGYQGEIMSISTASQQLEVFSRIFKTSIENILLGSDDDAGKNLTEFTRMVCHGEHTFLYSQALLGLLTEEVSNGAHIKRISQEITKYGKEKGFDVTPIAMALNGSSSFPRACQALAAMLSKNALNPADITVLYKLYSANDTPPVDLIREAQFLDLLVDFLFRPNNKINPDHKPKYIYLLAYAASVYEVNKPRKIVNKEELKATIQAIEKVQIICIECKGVNELTAEVNTLYQCIRFPVVAIGVLRWVDRTVTDKSYFKLNTEQTPLHLALLDEIVTCHNNLHQKVLDLLTRLFEAQLEEMNFLVQLEKRKILLDRMVHLFSRGHVVPVVQYIKSCWQKQDTDISLIRYFVTEVLEIIAPPYTIDFVSQFLPLVDNDEITGTMRSQGEHASVSEFILHCRTQFASLTAQT